MSHSFTFEEFYNVTAALGTGDSPIGMAGTELSKEQELEEEDDRKEQEKQPVPETTAPKSKPNYELLNFEGSNALLYRLYVKGDFIGCKSLIGVSVTVIRIR
uniref:Uncharacterized protein n=1 Tax=Angiostrongylus cantonensis TaxID=6313 RepID=A0A0K0D9G7_ANGCA